MGGLSNQTARLVSRKWETGLHRIWTHVQLAPELGPWTFFVQSAWRVQERDGSTWSNNYPVLAFFWPDAFYQVFMLFKSSGIEYYCNFISPAHWNPTERAVEFVDLDLDLYLSDHGPELLDEDEFAARRAAYPQEWVRAVVAAAETLWDLASTRTGPFSPAVERRCLAWLQEHSATPLQRHPD